MRCDLRPAWLFPRESRSFEGQRWVQITLRSLHLIGLAGAGGVWLHGAEGAAVQAWVVLVVVSGLAMAALHVWSNGIWLLQVRGLATLTKVVLVAVAGALGGAVGAMLFVIAVALSGVFAHAPGVWRYYVPVYGGVLHAAPAPPGEDDAHGEG